MFRNTEQIRVITQRLHRKIRPSLARHIPVHVIQAIQEGASKNDDKVPIHPRLIPGSVTPIVPSEHLKQQQEMEERMRFWLKSMKDKIDLDLKNYFRSRESEDLDFLTHLS